MCCNGYLPKVRFANFTNISRSRDPTSVHIMNALPEDGDKHEGGITTNLFTATESLHVSHQGLLSCATKLTANIRSESRSYVIKAKFGQCSNFPSSPLCEKELVYCVYSSIGKSLTKGMWSGSANDFKQLQAIAVPDDVREVCQECFCKCENLRYVTFGASSKLERICAEAFRGTKIESVSIPDSVIELGERCFDLCVNLSSVTFGTSPKLKRICDSAFSGACIELVCIPDSVVELCVRF